MPSSSGMTPLLFLLLSASCHEADRAAGSIERRPPGEIEISATVHARAFDRGWHMPGYNAVVGAQGRMRHAALLRADVTDGQVLAALESLGAVAGDNLSMAAWEKRKDPSDPAPDTVIEGSPIEVLLRLPGRKDLVPLASVLEDPAGRGLELRFGGNARNIPRWRSGCIVCLYSCPGSKVGNASYTVRDYVNGLTRFRVKPGSLPEDGTRVGVVFRLPKAS